MAQRRHLPLSSLAAATTLLAAPAKAFYAPRNRPPIADTRTAGGDFRSADVFAGLRSEQQSEADFAKGGSRAGAVSTASVAAASLAAMVAVKQKRSRCIGMSRYARGGEAAPRVLAPEDAWISQLDLEGFGREVKELGEKLKNEQGEADNKHLRKMIWWSRLCAIAGIATMWMGPNPFSVIALSLWTHSSWAMIGHHVCHGGYNRCDDYYSSRGFALGTLWRRVVDWFDWMLPEAWGVEHNQMHHYRLGEDMDPDLVERNSQAWTGVEKYTMPILSMLVWKWAYYAPNTYKELKIAELLKAGKPLPEGFDPQAPITIGDMMAKDQKIFSLGELFSRVVGPYFLIHFFLLPLPFLLFGQSFFLNALCNLALADILSNIHGFIVIVTNHAGNDLYRFGSGCKPKSPTFYLRAVTSSANFATGGDVNDFMHGWLNYQIEHHCWPDLSMLAYQKAQAPLKAICEKYGVPYVQENVFVRLKKTLDIMTGNAKMRVYPEDQENPKDLMVWSDEKVRMAVAA